MRITTGSLFRTLAALGLLPAAVAIAQSGNPKSQLIYLPDPTPRETDPHLLLHDNPQAGTSVQETVEARNAKRHQLVEWAAGELVILSARLELDVTMPKTKLSNSDAQADAEKIEALAKNLTLALKTQ